MKNLLSKNKNRGCVRTAFCLVHLILSGQTKRLPRRFRGRNYSFSHSSAGGFPVSARSGDLLSLEQPHYYSTCSSVCQAFSGIFSKFPDRRRLQYQKSGNFSLPLSRYYMEGLLDISKVKNRYAPAARACTKGSNGTFVKIIVAAVLKTVVFGIKADLFGELRSAVEVRPEEIEVR